DGFPRLRSTKALQELRGYPFICPLCLDRRGSRALASVAEDTARINGCTLSTSFQVTLVKVQLRATSGTEERSECQAVRVAPRGRFFTLASKDLLDRKSTRLNSSHVKISYAVFCLKE